MDNLAADSTPDSTLDSTRTPMPPERCVHTVIFANRAHLRASRGGHHVLPEISRSNERCRSVSAFDYVFPLLLILSVVRQVRGKHLSWFQLAWPVALVIWAGAKYLHGVPTNAADVFLVVGCAVIGVVLGIGAGVFTTVYRRSDGTLMAKATAVTLVLWVLGTIGRLVFGLYAENGGAAAITSFSTAHSISVTAWGPALILMALCEVGGRTLILATRAIRAHTAKPESSFPVG